MTIRLDADVIAWFKETVPQYQTAVNRVLREYRSGMWRMTLRPRSGVGGALSSLRPHFHWELLNYIEWL